VIYSETLSVIVVATREVPSEPYLDVNINLLVTFSSHCSHICKDELNAHKIAINNEGT
jgi:hypothetical protein